MPYYVKKLRHFVNYMAFYSHFTTNAPLTIQRKNDAGGENPFPENLKSFACNLERIQRHWKCLIKRVKEKCV